MKSAAVFSLFIWSICSSCLYAFTPSSVSSHKSKSFIALHNKFSFTNHASNQQHRSRIPKLFTATNNDNNNNDASSSGVRYRMRKSVTSAKERVKRLLPGLSDVEDNVVQFTKKGGQPIAEVLADAAMSAAEMAAEEVRSTALSVILRSPSSGSGRGKTLNLETQAQIEADALVAMDSISLAKTSVADAFDAAEMALTEVEEDIARARRELEAAKRDATLGLAVAEKAAAEAVMNARDATERAFEVAFEATNGAGKAAVVVAGGEVKVQEVEETKETIEQSEKASVAVSDETRVEAETEVTIAEEETIENEDIPEESQSDFDVSTLKYEDVDYTLTDMAPPFINEDECLVPGEPVVRVEKAPQNSRRIFAGIDIPVSVDDVWKLLTDYPNLQKVVPNLVVNEVLELYSGGEGEISVDTSLSDEDQCKAIANHMKGAVLKQVGGAKVVGINFSARTTLEVREWPSGMPDFAHFEDEIYQGKSRGERVRESKGRELTRYVFPRPFALSSLPHKDISMQSIEKDDGEFRMYQGVWRMQPLPGCSPPGESAMRLTYAVEVSPRPYLPVALVEGRIAQDLCANLKAIREIMTR
mmetsp:Transcript_30011/g.45407  ORF Transcript_30011/g.45407 Transcript_30011/m.45407 type:complete len:588 (-) Transcript_30011:384-2147(-)